MRLFGVLHDAGGQHSRVDVVQWHVQASRFHGVESCLDIVQAAVHNSLLARHAATQAVGQVWRQGVCHDQVVVKALLHSFQALLNRLHELLKPHVHLLEAMSNIVAYAIQLVGETAQVLRNRRGFLAWGRGWHAGLVVVTGLLDDKTPLVGKRHLTDSFGTERAVDFACRGVALLGRTVVLDTAAVAHKVVARRLRITVVGGAELDDTVAIVLGDTLDSGQEVVKRAVDALGGRGQCRGGRRGDGSASNHLAGRRHSAHRCVCGNRAVCRGIGMCRCALVLLGDGCGAGRGRRGTQAPGRSLLGGVGSQCECLTLR